MMQVKLTTREREDHALGVLLDYLREARGESWQGEVVPEGPKPMFDRLLTNQVTGEQVALEITSFDWPVARTTTQMRLHSLAAELENKLTGSHRGIYLIAADINEVDEGDLFKPKKGPKKRKLLEGWCRQHLGGIGDEEEIVIPVVSGLRVTRLSSDGELSITVPVTTTSTGYPNWMLDLEEVLKDNARKFTSVQGMSRWLLVPYLGIGHRLELTGPVLELPAEIDELFFIDYRDDYRDWDDERSSSKGSSPAHIVEYGKVRQKYVGEYDRKTGAYRVPVSVLRPAPPQEQGE